MAENIDSPSLFSIQDTMEMGMGNQELLNDLFSPETASSDPDDVTAIIKDANAPDAPDAPAVKKGTKTLVSLAKYLQYKMYHQIKE